MQSFFKIRNLLAASVFGLTLTCLQLAFAQQPTDVPAVKIDTTTPENALKSYWAYLDWREQTAERKDNNYLQSKQHDVEQLQRDQLMADNRLAYEKQRDEKKLATTYVREITKVKMEGKNKAVILANLKNIVPTGDKVDMKKLSQPQKIFLRFKEMGTNIQYELELQANGWRVVEVLNVVNADGMTTPSYTSPQIANELITVLP